MACLLKAPDGLAKGCVVFTTQERDRLVYVSPSIRTRIESIKGRYFVGLHHNWHDYEFRYDPLFDFSMAGHGDLIEADGRDFPYVPLDACNFAPAGYSQSRQSPPFWDILYVARAVAFKGIPEFFQAIRGLYDQGYTPRVLFVCPTPSVVEIPGIPDLRAHFEALFTASERERITFLTIEWDYPFPLDAETLAFFYRSSRIFFHPAPEERRCRTAAYAWAGKMPVVANSNAASILPVKYHRPPFLYTFEDAVGMVIALAAALEHSTQIDEEWANVVSEFTAQSSASRLDEYLRALAMRRGGYLSSSEINVNGLDIRLGRHHGLAIGRNRIDFSLGDFSNALLNLSDEKLNKLSLSSDPEMALQDAMVGRSAEDAIRAVSIGKKRSWSLPFLDWLLSRNPISGHANGTDQKTQ